MTSAPYYPLVNSGCKFGNQTINHISYADDLLIFCPSSKGLQGLLNQCEIYGTEHDIKYNKDKTVCMIIKPVDLNFGTVLIFVLMAICCLLLILINILV